MVCSPFIMQGQSIEKTTSDTLCIDNIKFRNANLVLSIDYLVDKYGEPHRKIENGGLYRVFNSKGKPIKKVRYDLWFYDHITFSVWESKARLHVLIFKETSFKVETSKISLNKETTLEEIKQLFPNSYRNRTFAAWYLNDYLPNENIDKNQDERVVVSISNCSNGSLQLCFIRNKLAAIEFDIRK